MNVLRSNSVDAFWRFHALLCFFCNSLSPLQTRACLKQHELWRVGVATCVVVSRCALSERLAPRWSTSHLSNLRAFCRCLKCDFVSRAFSRLACAVACSWNALRNFSYFFCFTVSLSLSLTSAHRSLSLLSARFFNYNCAIRSLVLVECVCKRVCIRKCAALKI